MSIIKADYGSVGGVDWSPYFNTVISRFSAGNTETCVMFPCKGMRHISITNLNGNNYDYYIYGRKNGADTQLYFGRAEIASLDISGYDYLVCQRTGAAYLTFDVTLLD